MYATLISCNEATGRGAARFYNRGRITAKRTWIVIFDSAGDIPNMTEVITATGLPALGAAHPTEASAVVVQIGDPEETDNRYVYRVPVLYDTDTGVQLETSPLNDPWRANFSSESRPKIVTQTIVDSTWLTEGDTIGSAASKAIANKADEPFDTPPSESNDLEIITLTHNVAAPDPEALGAYRNSMNAAAITVAARVIPRWTGKMLNIGIDGPNYRNGVKYYVVTFRIGVIVTKMTGGSPPKPMETWAHKFANMGYKQRVGGTAVPSNITLADGTTTVRQAMPLSSTGVYDPDPAKTACYVWLVFATLNEAAWSGLSLPTTLP